MTKVTVKTTLGEILHAPYINSWDDFCEKYGYSEWCINEGRAEEDEVVEISLQDAKRYGLLKEEEV